jgi:hypothetical protein
MFAIATATAILLIATKALGRIVFRAIIVVISPLTTRQLQVAYVILA